jgi:hypothetical protein
MFRVGDKVIVQKVNKSDPPLGKFEAMEAQMGTLEHCSQLVGRLGTVEKVEEGTGGVGDSPGDPFYIVGFVGGRRDGFWGEELRPLVGRP